MRTITREQEFVPTQHYIDITTGEVVRMLRVKMNWSQTELAQKSGLTNNNISLIEHDKVDIGKQRALALAKAFGVHPAIILFPEYEIGKLHTKRVA